MRCRHCHTPLKHTFLDLGFAPPSNAYLTAEALKQPETYYPLKVKVCVHCWLVQTEDYAAAGSLFTEDYAYFSSTSSSWVAHAKRYSIDITQKLALSANSLVVEVASNDGYLLRNFVASGIPCLGIEPTASTATAAERLGISVLREFFGEKLAQRLAAEGRQADLIIGNNVYAHVPDINDFTRGLATLLKSEGIVTLEFPHLLQLIEHTQFDTVYHEHFSYLALGVVTRIFAAAGLRVYDVEELSTHGGSLRIYGCLETAQHSSTHRVAALVAREAEASLTQLSTYTAFQAQAEQIKNNLLEFLLEQKRNGRRVAAYGAAAKGNTLLNYAGVKPDLLAYVCDAAPAKQGKYLPGSHIPILPPEALRENPPDSVLILPWNLADELMPQVQSFLSPGLKLVTAVPALKCL